MDDQITNPDLQDNKFTIGELIKGNGFTSNCEEVSVCLVQRDAQGVPQHEGPAKSVEPDGAASFQSWAETEGLASDDFHGDCYYRARFRKNGVWVRPPVDRPIFLHPPKDGGRQKQEQRAKRAGKDAHKQSGNFAVDAITIPLDDDHHYDNGQQITVHGTAASSTMGVGVNLIFTDPTGNAQSTGLVGTCPLQDATWTVQLPPPPMNDRRYLLTARFMKTPQSGGGMAILDRFIEVGAVST